MKKFLLLIVLFCATFSVKAFAGDDIDSLKQQLQVMPNDSLKAGLYSKIAAYYLNYNIILDKRLKRNYQNEAIGYTLSAIRLYSKYSDTLNLRISFDNLVNVYHDQKKYSQAKWYILQSNALSRAKKDIPNVITSLRKLAAIKADIKDYRLAMRDLNEALSLSVKNHFATEESAVQKSYSMLYTQMKDPEKAAIALKRAEYLDDSIKRGEIEQVAKVQVPDSLQSKKKLYTIANKPKAKKGSIKKIALL